MLPLPLPATQVQTQLGEVIYQNDTPLLQTVKGNSAESWTESATAAAAATQSLSEATATANAKMLSIEEKIREQGEVLRVERELLQFSVSHKGSRTRSYRSLSIDFFLFPFAAGGAEATA